MNVEVQDDKLQGLTVTPERLRFEMAVGLYTREDVTFGQAADLVGMSQTEFLHEMDRRGVCVHYGVDDLEQDFTTMDSLGRA